MSIKDRFIAALDNGMRTIFFPATGQRPSPAEDIADDELTDGEKRNAAALMRVNHCGEVCAQALYQGQALFARDEQVAAALQESADEEIDHLAWTAGRIRELGGRQSFLNPLWYGGSFALGAATALLSDKISLGFVAETENQVSEHLRSHLEKLPLNDRKSRAIVEQMDFDEQQHASKAVEMGGMELPPPAKAGMKLLGRIMTCTSAWL